MAQQDLKNNQNIRRILVRHWIDLGRIGIYSAGGRVTIRGTMQLLRGVKNELDSQLMDNIFAELRRIKEIKRIVPELDNWAFVEGAWHRKDESQRNQSLMGDDQQSSYEI